MKTLHFRVFKTGVLDNGVFDNVLTRGQYNQALAAGKIFERIEAGDDTGYFKSDLPYSEAVENNGGFTVVTQEVNGIDVHAKHNFNKKPFSRKVGRGAAIAKLVAQGVNV